jgi:hypothetical protein
MARNKGNNTRNPNSPLFKRLTRLFSGPIVNYRAQIARQERRNELDKYRYKFRSLSGQEFKRATDNLSQNYNLLSSHAMRNQNRGERYQDFEQMEYMPEIASAIDIYADEMTTSNEFDRLLTVDCLNLEIKTILDSLFYDALNIEFNAFGWARSMVKFGDFFLYLDIDEQMGVKSVIGLPGEELERLEGQDPSNPNYVQYQWNGAGMTFEDWQVAHFRILGNDKYSPYGTSILDPARRIWRQLVLLEDAMIAYRVVRAPERRVFKIDVGNIPPQDVPQYMEKVKTEMKRNQLVTPTSGRVDLRYNPLSIEEDYFIPMRGGVGSTIESLPGAKSLDDIEDVKYLRDKMFSALKVPQSYLTNLDGADEDKTTLAQKDIRFARTIQRLQRSIMSELEKIAVVHLYTIGFRGEDLVSFKLSLNNPSRLAELQQLEYMRTKFDIANAVPEGVYSKRWLSKNILGMSDDEFLRNQRETFYDKKYQQALEGVQESAAAEEMAGGLGGGDLGGDLGGGDLGGDLGGDALGGEELAGGGEEDESALLTAPARKDDGHVSQYKKGRTYYRKDGRADGRRENNPGPFRRNIRSQVAPENITYSSPDRSRVGHSLGRVRPGDLRETVGRVGIPDLSALVSLEENDISTYTKDEVLLLENTTNIRKLIAQLESKETETDETQ